MHEHYMIQDTQRYYYPPLAPNSMAPSPVTHFGKVETHIQSFMD